MIGGSQSLIIYFIVGVYIITYLFTYNIFGMEGCPNCGHRFDNHLHEVTVVCEKNHLLCRTCARQLEQNRTKCGQCDPNLHSNNPYGLRDSFGQAPSIDQQVQQQPKSNSEHQPYYNQGYNNQNPWPNQGFQPNTTTQKYSAYSPNQGSNQQIQGPNRNNPNYFSQHSQGQPNSPVRPPQKHIPKWASRPKLLIFLFVLSVVLFGAMLGLRISMENC